MDMDTASPATNEAANQPEASDETKALNAAIDSEPGANSDTDEKTGSEAAPKKEKTPEEVRLTKLERKLERALRQRAEARAELEMMRQGVARQPIEEDNNRTQRDNETLSLSRQELQELIASEAKKLAPTIKQQEAEMERRGAVVKRLAEAWGEEKFKALGDDLDDAFGGLRDRNGQPKPAADAIFEADDPAALIEYLADPEHADEADAIGRMGAVQAGRAIAKLETKLAAKKAQAKPQPSKAAPPIEDIRGQGGVNTKRLADLSDAEFEKRRRQQIANRR